MLKNANLPANNLKLTPRSSVASDSYAENFLENCDVELLSLFKPRMCCVFVCFCSLDLNVKNSVIWFFCLSVQISVSIIPTRPDNRGSTVSNKFKSF